MNFFGKFFDIFIAALLIFLQVLFSLEVLDIYFIAYFHVNLFIYLFIYFFQSFRYFHDLIMPCEEYSSLKELLLDPSLEAVQALADVSHRDRNPLATSLLRIFRSVLHRNNSLMFDFP